MRAGVCVLIPAYNEARGLAATLKAIGRLQVAEVIVVDDGSSDGTACVARDAGARLVQLDRNRGKGAAIQAGLAEVRSELVLLLDADLGQSALQAQALLPPVANGYSDMTVAVFSCTQRPGGGLGLAVSLARWGIRRYSGHTFLAPLSGQRAIRTETLQSLLPLPPDFGFEVGLTLKALRAGLRIEEVPLPLEHRVTGRSPRDCWHRGRQFYQIGKALISFGFAR